MILFKFIYVIKFVIKIVVRIVVMNKEIWKIIIKVLIYALGLLGAYLGVSAVTSCTIQRSSEHTGKAVIVTVDTTIVNHSGSLRLSYE